MQRDYDSGEQKDITFFVGNEVECTPAYGLKTLFITGLQTVESIQLVIDKIDNSNHSPIGHLFFGANHSFNPRDSQGLIAWEQVIQYFLNKDYLCSLDIPIDQASRFTESVLCEYNNFIPQIRVPIPHVRLWNYNTMIKIDDIGFNATNPGIWTHSLHDLQDRSKFTDWQQYKKDKVIK